MKGMIHITALQQLILPTYFYLDFLLFIITDHADKTPIQNFIGWTITTIFRQWKNQPRFRKPRTSFRKHLMEKIHVCLIIFKSQRPGATLKRSSSGLTTYVNNLWLIEGVICEINWIDVNVKGIKLSRQF